MKKKFLVIIKSFFVLSIFFSVELSFGQSYDEIINSGKYLYGEGKGFTLKQADNEAIEALISQISINIVSSSEEIVSDVNSSVNSNFISILKTYSAATLNNAERIVIGQEPEAKVIRFIKKSDVKKIFEERENKILSFYQAANYALQQNKIADAIKYYYWSIILTKSHPYSGSILTEDGKQLSAILPLKINEVFDGIRFTCEEINTKKNYTDIILNITYNGDPISNLDYSFFDGRDWATTITAKDGKGIIELYGAATQLEAVNVKVEYIFENEAKVDQEVEMTMEQIDPIPFKKSYITLPLKKAKKNEIVDAAVNDELKLVKIEASPYQSIIKLIAKGIEEKDSVGLKKYFTDNGLDVFVKLMQYGNAKILPFDELKTLAFQNSVVCRSVPVVFSFSNNKKFIENVVFHFNDEMKIETLSFSLGYESLNDIVSKNVWDDVEKFIIINFLEHYKTAYALKRLDYIESIFDDNALIITGHIVKRASGDNIFANNEIVKYNRQSKQDYIKRLKHSFESKEYINIKFEESNIAKAGVGKSIYGIQIKQNYFSSNYGDKGYLFLIIDLKSSNEPIIHVRTWQPKKNPDGSIYGLEDF